MGKIDPSQVVWDPINPADVVWDDDPPPQAEAKANPTEGMSGGQRFAAGAGKAVGDFVTGIKQRGALLADTMNGQELRAGPGIDNSGRFPRTEAVRKEILDTRVRDQALLDTGAGMAGNVAGNLGMLAPASLVPGLNTIGGSAVLGAGLGAMAPAASVDEGFTNSAIGAGAGGAGASLAKGVGVVVRPSSLPASANRAAAPILAEGGRLSPGQASGSRTLQQLEASMSSFPATQGALHDIGRANQAAMNRLAARSIGESADSLTDDVVQRAEQRIGGVFNRVATPNPFQVDANAMLNRIAALDHSLRGVTDVASNPLVGEALTIAQAGQSSGKQLQHLSSRLRAKARSEMTSAQGDRELGKALLQVRELIDDQLQQALPQAERAAFKEARDQYRNLMLITRNANVLNEASGDISGANLATTLRSQDRSGYLFGRQRPQSTKDLFSVARFARAFRPVVGDSGTATRSVLPQMAMQMAGGAGAGAVAGGASGGDATTGAAAGAMIPLVLAAAARGYVSPTVVSYVQRGLPAFQASPAVAGRLAAWTPLAAIGGANAQDARRDSEVAQYLRDAEAEED